MTDTCHEALAGDGTDIRLFNSYIDCHSTLSGSDYKDVPLASCVYRLHINAQCHYCDFRYIIRGLNSQGEEILIEDRTVSNRTEGTGAWSKYEYDIDLYDRFDGEGIASTIRHISIKAYVNDKAAGYDNADLTISGFSKGITWLTE